MDMIAIGSRIIESRERPHLTQAELDTFVKIVNALNLSADALLRDGPC